MRTRAWTEVNYGHAQTGYGQAGRSNGCDGKPCPAFTDAKNNEQTWLWTGQPLSSEELMTKGGIQPNDRGHAALAEAFLKAYDKAEK